MQDVIAKYTGPRWRSWPVATLAAICLYTMGGVFIHLQQENTIYLFWPPAGFAFAALWWFGRRAVPGIAIGSLLVSYFIANDHHVVSIVPIAVICAAEALFPVWWLRRQGIRDIFHNAESILKFILSSALVAPAAAAALGTLVLWMNGLQSINALPQTWLSWWVGDSMGLLLTAPFLLALKNWRIAVPSLGRLVELVVALACLSSLWFTLFTEPPARYLPPLIFLAVPVVIWIAIRFNIAALTTALAVTAVVAVQSTASGLGPFVRGDAAESIAHLYGFLGVLMAIGLFLCVAIAHSKRSMEALERKNIELQVSEDGLRKTLESTPNVAVQWFDKQGRVLYWNNASLTLYGWTPEEAKGKTLDQLIYTPEAAEHFAHILEVISDSNKMVGPAESKVRHRNGRIGHIVSTVFAMPEADGVPRRFVCIDVDVTPIKESEIALQQAKADADAANRAKSQFLSNMSHEMRTPMNAITGFAELALGETKKGLAHDYLLHIKNASAHLLSLINNILSMAKIESGKLDLIATPFSLHNVVEHVFSISSVGARTKQVEILREVDERIPDTLIGDPVRLIEILSNLMGNAIKFTHHGQATLSIKLVEQYPGCIRLQFAVEDTGIGMTEAQIADIFEPFTQADSSITKQYGGTGLGLAISQRLTELMGGTISVESKLGHGSRFSLLLDFGVGKQPAAPEPAPERAAVHYAGIHALVAEDDQLNQIVARGLLENMGMSVTIAGTGQEVLDILAATPGRYDVVFMDMRMPDINGIEAAKAIRKTYGADTLPIIAMTANAFETDRQTCLDAGMDAFISKPVEPAQLWKTVSIIMDAKRKK